jgi:hypothetical protein
MRRSSRPKPETDDYLLPLSYGGVHTRGTYRNFRFLGQLRRRIEALCRTGALKAPSRVFRRIASDANMLTGILWQIADT